MYISSLLQFLFLSFSLVLLLASSCLFAGEMTVNPWLNYNLTFHPDFTLVGFSFKLRPPSCQSLSLCLILCLFQCLSPSLDVCFCLRFLCSFFSFFTFIFFSFFLWFSLSLPHMVQQLLKVYKLSLSLKQTHTLSTVHFVLLIQPPPTASLWFEPFHSAGWTLQTIKLSTGLKSWERVAHTHTHTQMQWYQNLATRFQVMLGTDLLWLLN